MKKKLLAILTSVLLLCAMLPLSAVGVSAATSGITGNCTWTLDGTHLTISGNGKMADYYYEDAPWMGYVTSVTIEDGVTSIGRNAFYDCYRLDSISIPDSVTSIGDSAFLSCKSLTSVTIPDSVTSIGNMAFGSCDVLNSVTLPATVTAFGDYVFMDCICLKSAIIPAGVTYLYYTFYNCWSLEFVVLPDSVTYIYDGTFYECESLTDVYYAGSEADKANITIYDDWNDPLFNATWHCDFSLTSGTTGDCTWTLDGTHLSISGNGKMGDYGSNNGLKKLLWNNITSVTIADGVTSIGNYAFYGCKSLTSATIPDSVTSIGDDAFSDCSSLTAITIPDSVTSIGNYAFYGCKSLTSVTIPDSVTSIGKCAFFYCSSLNSVTIGGGVTFIGYWAFHYCTSLTDVYYGGSEADKANITIESPNEVLLNATWHYADDPISDTVAHSVMDTANGNGLAFRFALNANGVATKKHTEVDLSNATINYLGTDVKLVGMGAVLTNDANLGNGHLTIDQSNGQNVVDIPVVYVQDVTDTSCAFAVRIINIPDEQLERTIYARPYYIIEVDGEEIVVYGDVDSASCAQYM